MIFKKSVQRVFTWHPCAAESTLNLNSSYSEQCPNHDATQNF